MDKNVYKNTVSPSEIGRIGISGDGINGSQQAKNKKVHSSHVTAMKFIGKKRLV